MTQVIERGSKVLDGDGQLGSQSRVGGFDRTPGTFELGGNGQHPLLGAVVEVAVDSLALGVRGGNDARSRGADFCQPIDELGL